MSCARPCTTHLPVAGSLCLLLVRPGNVTSLSCQSGVSRGPMTLPRVFALGFSLRGPTLKLGGSGDKRRIVSICSSVWLPWTRSSRFSRDSWEYIAYLLVKSSFMGFSVFSSFSSQSWPLDPSGATMTSLDGRLGFVSPVARAATTAPRSLDNWSGRVGGNLYLPCVPLSHKVLASITMAT